MLEILCQRRSVRVFTEEVINEEMQNKIIKAGLLAPTGMGKQTVEFIIINDKNKIIELVDVKKHSSKPFKTATFAIIVLGNTQETDTWIEDASLAAMYMQLQITHLGLGSTWIQVDKRDNYQGQASAQFLRERFHFPQHLQPLCVLAIGHKEENPQAYSVENINFSSVHFGKY